MGKTQQLNLVDEHKQEYAASARAAQRIMIGKARFLSSEGQGAPESEAFGGSIEAMYGVAYTIKMTRKFAGLGDYKVAPLEGLWWSDVRPEEFMAGPREQWRWKLLIRTPDFIAEKDLAAARESLRAKKKPPRFEQVRLETLDEGDCVQMLHVGPYADEPRTCSAMQAFIEEHGLSMTGRHHEIYLCDPRRTAAERLKTILRFSVEKRQPPASRLR
jgi:hypothetical protein